MGGRTAAVAASVVAAVAVPLLVQDVYRNIVALAAIYGIVALSMNLLVGYTGQISLGHAGFFGVGAFATGYVVTEIGAPFVVALVVAAATGALATLLLGWVSLRVGGLYLALITIAYGLFAQATVFNIRTLTHGGAGMPAFRPDIVQSDLAYAYLCIGVLGLTMLFDRRLLSTRTGRAILALRDDERVAASWGVEVTRYKVVAFVLSGVLVGIAGGLFASLNEIVTPQDFTFTLSLTFLLMTVVGGTGNRWGVVQGGIVFAALPTLLSEAHDTFAFPPFTLIDATWEPAIGALLLLLVLVAFPGGIAQQEEELAGRLRSLAGRGRRAHEVTGAAP